jgi:integrase
MSTVTVGPLRQRMIEDMNARKLCAGTQRGHIHSCRRFAAFLKQSPDTATAEDIRRFQFHLSETGVSICNRNRIMTGLRFLLRVTLRRLDLAAEIYHIREPQKIPLVMSQDETRRLLAVASSLKARTLLSLGYGCGLRAGEVVRLKVKHIDRAQNIIPRFHGGVVAAFPRHSLRRHTGAGEGLWQHRKHDRDQPDRAQGRRQPAQTGGRDRHTGGGDLRALRAGGRTRIPVGADRSRGGRPCARRRPGGRI